MIRHRHYTYAVYFSPSLPCQYQYELYNLETDIKQMNNLLFDHRRADVGIKVLWSGLQVLLNQKLAEAGQEPFPPVGWNA